MASRTPRNIVLADDDSDDRDLFTEAVGLINPEVQVSIVKDGEELIDYLTKNLPGPDMIFLDLNMPRKNGKECLDEITSHAVWKEIPVVIYTTSINPKDVDDCTRKGAFDFIRKPNSFEGLKTILNGFLNNGGADDSGRQNI